MGDKPARRQVELGIYEDADGVIHVIIPEYLAAHEIPDTPDARAVMLRLARQAIRRVFRGAVIVEEEG